MNDDEERIKKLKGWKVYYINMYKKTNKKVYYNGLKRILFFCISMRSRIVHGDLTKDMELEDYRKACEVKKELDEGIDEMKEYLKDDFIMMGNNKIYKELLKHGP